MIMIKEGKKEKEPDYSIISAWILRHLKLNRSLIHLHATTPSKQTTVYDMTARSFWEERWELKAHMDEQEAVSCF